LNETSNIYVKVGFAVQIPCKGGGLGQDWCSRFSRSCVTGLKLTHCSSICDSGPCNRSSYKLNRSNVVQVPLRPQGQIKNSSGVEPSETRTQAILMSLQLERRWCLDLYIIILILRPGRAQIPDRSNGFGLAARE
jgi:hypothetical protein